MAARALSTVVKRTTGIVGLPVAHNAQKTLTALYAQTLEALEALPETAQYRVNVEQMTRTRLDAVKKATSVQELEEMVNAGQVEELIVAAKNELKLIPKIAAGKPWETSKASKLNVEVI
ncbi:NADH dehydrogenase 1 alpha subcomplex subunit 5 [Thecamonas trahens ATCC 50062]|uniref:NADH dehydrogenase 1 alpha subcomplex subunit 5 n=1 Tax=Thecamonas trahens ATCC 50062 TaxID=461836 RepID=A0A0L0D6U5_THETB|nr:NADH dehydrogenase 1 alpha subcomplex subunit 5 [Thecamonas trahens ATCC 50062]KNC47935.1 NADH dehydrogenase 1 alpha subcomplex subunit 5 [Thecamonas trahens ATCC 50062]|eukprot:XP_013758954.1 NADH dehydrogenase 1 alpha subcomplex subunit 5 [Thecamonas trahens ATCC 50062]